MKIKEIIHWLLPSRRWKMVAIALSGLIIGGGLFFLYMLRAHTYLGESGRSRAWMVCVMLRCFSLVASIR